MSGQLCWWVVHVNYSGLLPLILLNPCFCLQNHKFEFVLLPDPEQAHCLQQPMSVLSYSAIGSISIMLHSRRGWLLCFPFSLIMFLHPSFKRYMQRHNAVSGNDNEKYYLSFVKYLQFLFQLCLVLNAKYCQSFNSSFCVWGASSKK